MASSFVYLQPVEVTVSNNESGSNATIDSVAVPTADAWQCVDEGGDGDGDDSFVRLDATTGRSWRFRLQTPAEAGATNMQSIDQVEITMVRRRANVGTGGRCQLSVLAGGAIYLDPNQPLLTTSFSSATFTYATNPNTGQAWDKQDFERRTFELGAVRPTSTGGTSFVIVTALYAKLVYTVTPWSALPPATGEWSTEHTGDGGWVSLPVETDLWTRVPS